MNTEELLALFSGISYMLFITVRKLIYILFNPKGDVFSLTCTCIRQALTFHWTLRLSQELFSQFSICKLALSISFNWKMYCLYNSSEENGLTWTFHAPCLHSIFLFSSVCILINTIMISLENSRQNMTLLNCFIWEGHRDSYWESFLFLSWQDTKGLVPQMSGACHAGIRKILKLTMEGNLLGNLHSLRGPDIDCNSLLSVPTCCKKFNTNLWLVCERWSLDSMCK